MDGVQKVEIIRMVSQTDWINIIFSMIGTCLGATFSILGAIYVLKKQFKYEQDKENKKKENAVNSIKSLIRNEVIYNYKQMTKEMTSERLTYFSMISDNRQQYVIVGSNNIYPFKFKDYENIKLEMIKYSYDSVLSDIFYIYQCLEILCLATDFNQLTEDDRRILHKLQGKYDDVLKEL